MFSETSERVLWAIAVLIITFLVYRLRDVEQRFQELRDEMPAFLASSEDIDAKPLTRKISEALKPKKSPKVTIFLDGAFDLTHYGHMNAFRQARALGTRLVVGLNSDESITRCKGRPILNGKEREEVVFACRFVDQIVPDVPYVMTPEYITELMEKYDIDYFVHGDDPCTVDGKDVYADVKEMGKFKFIPRTEGVSTTDIVGRILTLTKNNNAPDNDLTSPRAAGSTSPEPGASLVRMASKQLPGGPLSAPARTFYPTCRMMRCFGEAMSNAAPKRGETVVYIAGDWDIFNASHVHILKKARDFGDYVLVGVHSDEAMRAQIGGRPPIFNLYERVLAVLACKHVDDVVLGADLRITAEMIASFGINKVLRIDGDHAPDSAYSTPKDMGILHTLVSDMEHISAETIAGRILQNWDAVVAKQKAKAQKEKDFYDHKYGNT